LRQALLSQAFPSGEVKWGGQTLPSQSIPLFAFDPVELTSFPHVTVNSMLLDITGILFAAQLVLLLTIGPYADYGTWRPWIMIGEYFHTESGIHPH
jgi:hypothetical protein